AVLRSPRPPSVAEIPEAASMADVRKFAAEVAAYIRWHFRTSCLAAIRALNDGDREELALFLQDLLHIPVPTSSVAEAGLLEAVWLVVLRSGRWGYIESEPILYLGVAIRREARRVKRNRDEADRIGELTSSEEAAFQRNLDHGRDDPARLAEI